MYLFVISTCFKCTYQVKCFFFHVNSVQLSHDGTNTSYGLAIVGFFTVSKSKREKF